MPAMRHNLSHATTACRVAAVLLLSGCCAELRADDPDNCLLCHQFRGLSRLDADTGQVHVFFVDPDYVHNMEGPHARLACTDCHPGDEVSIIPHRPVTPVNCTQTCHIRQPDGLAREYSHASVASQLAGSVHDPATLQGLPFTGGPLLAPEQSTCLYCHDEPLFRALPDWLTRFEVLGGDSRDRCQSCHANMLDAEAAYFLRHIAARLQPARPPLELAQVCSVCHSDPAVLQQMQQHNAVASFVRSFHGKAALLGEEDTANCLSCHASQRSVHTILAQSDPQSPVHPTRIADTCSTLECHPGASASFGTAAVHWKAPSSLGLFEYFLVAGFITLTALTYGPSALLVVLELFQAAIGRGREHSQRMHAMAAAVAADPRGRRRLTRFTVPQRIQHWLLAGLFILLVLTGFPLKFADTTWARWMIAAFGGLDTARLLHHWCGIVLFVGFIGHFLHIVGMVIRNSLKPRPDGRRTGLLPALTALPMWIDVEDLGRMRQLFAYLLFLRSDRPDFGRFSLKEKFEYIGVFWGTIILGVTGLVLWGEQYASHMLGGRAFNIAAIFHTYEAFLAVIHVGIIHIYGVILSPTVFPISMAMISGRTPVAELAEGHGEYVRQAARDIGLNLEESPHGH